MSKARAIVAYGLAALAIVLATLPREGLTAEQLRVGVLKFGTVSWQLDTLKVHRLDAAEDVDVEVVALASTNATSVALQAGAVDMIVSDWIWVMRQRGDGADLVFTPYSSALGAVVVGAQGDIRTLSDLVGRKIGVAGGPLDKSWLILQAWTRRRTSLDLGRNVDPVFAAPPLLSEEIRRGALPAVLTFWPDAARLEAEGFRRLLAVEDVLTDLGIEHPVPLVGYVFHDTLAKQRPQAVHGFFRAVAAANGILAVSDEEWLRLRPMMKAQSDQEFEGLKAGFRAGIQQSDTTGRMGDTERLYELLAEAGGDALLGARTRFDPKVFWTASAP